MNSQLQLEVAAVVVVAITVAEIEMLQIVAAIVVAVVVVVDVAAFFECTAAVVEVSADETVAESTGSIKSGSGKYGGVNSTLKSLNSI